MLWLYAEVHPKEEENPCHWHARNFRLHYIFEDAEIVLGNMADAAAKKKVPKVLINWSNGMCAPEGPPSNA
jgi:hypothetical protein